MFTLLEKSVEKKTWGEKRTEWRLTIPAYFVLLALALVLPVMAHSGWNLVK
jgi:hypothetical protein